MTHLELTWHQVISFGQQSKSKRETVEQPAIVLVFDYHAEIIGFFWFLGALRLFNFFGALGRNNVARGWS